MRNILTLCIVHQHPKVLLGYKKRGFGKGRWNGFGGKVEKGESIEEAAKREVQEEVRITVENLEKVGVIEFTFRGNPDILEVHIFRVQHFEGNPGETEEMKPQWFHVEKIPFQTMWSDDSYWFPLFLEGKKFRGKFLFDEHDRVLSHELSVVEEV